MPKQQYQHYPKVVDRVKDAAGRIEEIIARDGREHYKLAKADFLQDPIAKELYEPPAQAEESNLLQLKTNKPVSPPKVEVKPQAQVSVKTDTGA